MPNWSQQFPSSPAYFPNEADLLAELGRVTTAYHEAPPDLLEVARAEYERVLVQFKSRYSHLREPGEHS